MASAHRVVLTFAVLLGASQLVGCDRLKSPEHRIARAEEHIASGNDRAAFIELQTAVRREPELVRARLMLTELSLRLGDPKSADKELALASAHGASAEQTARLAAEIRLAQDQDQELLTLIDSGKSGLSESQAATFRGLVLLRTNRIEEATTALERALALDPDSSRARVALAQAMALSGKSDDALSALDVALKLNPKDAAALQARGGMLLRRGEFALAAASLEAARKNAAGQMSVTDYAAVLAGLTDAYLGAGDVARAEAMHAELAQRAPDAVATQLLAARIALTKHDYAGAVAHAQKLLASSPGLLQAKFLLGIALAGQGSLHQAEAQLAELVQMAPENVEARKLLARVNLQLQRPDIAMQLLSPVQQTNADDPQLAALLGVANLQSGNHEAGVAMLERSVEREPGNLDLKHDLAMAYVAARQNDKALKLLRSMPSGDRRQESLLISLLASSEGPQAARERVDQIVAANPDDADALSRAAVLYAGLNDLERARATLQKALKLQPDSVTALITLARVEISAGRTKDAMSAAQRAIAADPSSQLARLVTADIAASIGDTQTAIEQLEKVRGQDPKAVQPRIALARAYIRQNKTPQADAIIRELEPHAAGDPQVANAIGGLYSETGRFGDALRWFREASRQDPANPEPAFNIARTQLGMGDKTLARESLQKILAANADYIPAAAELVLLDFRENRQETALDRLAKLRAAHPTDVRVAVLDGDIAMSMKSYKAAAAAFEAAAKLDASGALAARIYRARRLGSLPNPTEPLTDWLKRQPGDAAVRLLLAESYQTTGQADRAIEQYEIAARGEPPNALALNNLAWIYHQRGDSRAKQLAKRAYDAAPQAPAIADTYGWILLETGEVDASLPILEKAAAAASSQPEIRYHYGAALAKAGQRDAARRVLGEIIRTNGQYPVAADARKLLAELGE